VSLRPQLSNYREASAVSVDDRLYIEQHVNGKALSRQISVAALQLSLAGQTLVDITASGTLVMNVGGTPSWVKAGHWVLVEVGSTNAEWRKIASISTDRQQLTFTVVSANTHGAGANLLFAPSPIWELSFFGAACDGTTDDTLPWNRAVADIRRAGGGTLRIPLGTTRIKIDEATNLGSNYTAAVTLTDNLIVEGTGPGSVIKMLPLSDNRVGYRAAFVSPLSSPFGCSNVVFRDFTFDQNGTANKVSQLKVDGVTSNTERYGFLNVGQGTNYHIERVRFIDISTRNLLRWSRSTGATEIGDVWVRDCIFDDVNASSDTNEYFDSSVIYCNTFSRGAMVVEGNTFNGGGIGKNSVICAVETHASNTRVRNNVINGFRTPFQLGGITHTNNSESQFIEGNILRDCWIGGILWSQPGTGTSLTEYPVADGTPLYRRVKIRNNFVHINLDGWARMTEPDGVTIEANRARGFVFKLDDQYPFEAIEITDNDIEFTTDLDVADTSVYDYTMNGIQMSFSASYTAADIIDTISIRGNTIRNAPSAAIVVDSVAAPIRGLSITDNKLINFGNHPTADTSAVPDKYRSGIFFRPFSATNWTIDLNQFASNVATPRCKYGIYGEQRVGGAIANVNILRGNSFRFIGGSGIPAYHWTGGSTMEAPFVDLLLRQSSGWTTPTYRARQGSRILHTPTGREYQQSASDATYFSGTSWRIGVLGGGDDRSIGAALSAYSAMTGLRGLWPLSQRVFGTQNPVDISALARTLTNTGPATFSGQGVITYAQFDGSTNYFTRADEAELDLTTSFTMGGWFYLSALPSGTVAYAISKWLSAGDQRSYALRFGSNGQPSVIVSELGTSATISTSGPTSISADTWYFVAGRYDGAAQTLRLYVADTDDNNLLVTGRYVTASGTVPSTIYNSTADFAIGASSGGVATTFVNGRVALPFLASVALDEDVIENLYNQSRALLMI
jgi:hypothetical protein